MQTAITMDNNQESIKDQIVEYLSDAEITAKIKAKFAVDDILNAIEIHVDTNNSGIVVLTGHGHSAEAQNRAKEIAEHTEGVRMVFTSWEQESVLD